MGNIVDDAESVAGASTMPRVRSVEIPSVRVSPAAPRVEQRTTLVRVVDASGGNAAAANLQVYACSRVRDGSSSRVFHEVRSPFSQLGRWFLHVWGNDVDIDIDTALIERTGDHDDVRLACSYRLPRASHDGKVGYVALLPDDGAVAIDQLSVIDGHLRVGPERRPVPGAYALLEIALGQAPPALDKRKDLEAAYDRLRLAFRDGPRIKMYDELRAVLVRLRDTTDLDGSDRSRIAIALKAAYDLRRFGPPLKTTPSWASFVASLPDAGSSAPINLDALLRHLDSAELDALRFPDDVQAPRVDTGAGTKRPAVIGAGTKRHVEIFGGWSPPATRPIDAPQTRETPPFVVVPPPPDMVVAPSPEEPPSIHWSTRLLDGELVVEDLMVVVGSEYTLETGLGPAPVANTLAGAALPVDAIADGTEVRFAVSCTQPILAAGGPHTARVEATARYDAATRRCGPVAFTLRPRVSGPLTLILGVYTSNALRASSRIALIASHTREPAPALSTLPIPCAPAALGGPGVEVRLELTPSGHIIVGMGATVERPRAPASAPAVLAGAALRARARLVELSRAYRADPTAPPFGLRDAAELRLEMAKVGRDLHEAFFGHPDANDVDADLKRLARALAQTPRQGGRARLQIAAAYQPFPWAVLYDGAYVDRPLGDASSVDIMCFWGRRLRIDRAIVGHVDAAHPPVIRAPVRVQPCLNPHLDNEQADAGVRVVAAQRALFANRADVAPYASIESGHAFKAYVQAQDDRPCDLLYVFCHARAARTRDELFTFTTDAPDTQAQLIFDATPGLSIDVRALRELRKRRLADHPLVFLNACSTAAGDEAFQSPLLAHFLDAWQARGVIGADWEVPTAFADAFARRVLDYFLRDHRALGSAFMLATREAFAQGNPFPLVYALYAPPELIVLPGAAA